ncbi:Ornithine/acetylornithine aminotransferase [Actinomyces bovis]|uniref:Ornithine/acetylornithine aminotransferase n=1 Tax=Actinomyces bovis TaxID=1658 RepID=A0ABY1VKJ1_9ACTO|nr:helicase HerA-like domain-containing protein [Actinomyces bovis]SPT52535.1 Ornithine/acetylornithine aminotransferase [Actinomyces bovis]VEG54284.1 Ornithine/acetylornithine aminotransferase [Actinomyces israelii]
MTDANNATEIARLKAEAAQAAAEAAAAKAAAAQAALDAALAACGGAPAEDQVAAPAAEAAVKEVAAQPTDPKEQAAAVPVAEAEAATEPAPTAAASTQAPPAEPAQAEAPAAKAEAPAAPAPTSASGYAETVRAGYDFGDAMLPVGTYLEMTQAPAPGQDPAPVAGLQVGIPLGLLNRHALVAGATGTGKTRTLQLLAEGLSSVGVPVFLSDIKGDLTGLAEPGQSSEKLTARTATTGQDWKGQGFPVELFTLGGSDSPTGQGAQGTPIRTTVTEFGPILLGRVLNLNDTQSSALQLVFHWADQQGLALIDLKDLRSVVDYLTNTEQGKEELRVIGGVSAATAGVILREVAALEAAGGTAFFGEPALNVKDLLRVASDGRGFISSLELQDIQSQGVIFSTFLMWLLGELFEVLPEVGDPDKPTMVFFFDEAHLLFNGATAAFLEAVTRTVRLIRSKGVGIVFITQSPTDVPDAVLAQLGSRIQHALRAHTPADAANLKKAVSTFPTSPLDLTKVLTSLGTGQAVVSVLDKKGRPAPVTAVVVNAPAAVMGPAQPATISQLLHSSPLRDKYSTAVDNESAFELLAKRLVDEQAAQQAAKEAEAQAAAEAKAAAEAEKAAKKEAERQAAALEKEAERQRREQEKEAARLQREAERQAERDRREAERAAERRHREIEKTIGSVGRQITRSILGNILRGR